MSIGFRHGHGNSRRVRAI